MGNKTVLVVDDSRVSRMMIRAFISDAYPDWKIVEAANGDDALSTDFNTPVNLMILDYNMPGMNGLTLYEQLKSNHPNASASLFTANIQNSIKDKASSLGVNFIEKPITEDKVKSIFQEIGA